MPGTVQSYLEKHLPNKSCLCALLETDGEPVAMAMLCAYEEMPDEVNVNGKGVKLSSVYTLSAFRGKGYMERLLLYLLEEAKKHGIQEISIPAERKAIPLYKRVGVQVAETIMFMEL